MDRPCHFVQLPVIVGPDLVETVTPLITQVRNKIAKNGFTIQKSLQM